MSDALPPFDPNSAEFREGLLRDARKAFPQYYANATPGEVHVMDALVLGHATMTVLVNTSRKALSAEMRSPLEVFGDQFDQLFASLREAVRASVTFRAIGKDEQDAIERLVFAVKLPLDER